MLIFPGESHELSRSGTPHHRRARFEHVLELVGAAPAQLSRAQRRLLIHAGGRVLPACCRCRIVPECPRRADACVARLADRARSLKV